MSSVDSLLDSGWEAYESEDWERAEDFGRQALAAAEESIEARLLIANALMNQGEHAEAAELLQDAVDAEPRDADCRLDLGSALYQCCRFVEAEVQYREAMTLSPESGDACYGLAMCLERNGASEEADRLFAQAARLQPDDFPTPARLTREQFQAAVHEAITELPGEFREALDNLVIQVRDLPDERLLTEFDPPLDPGLLGLFEGVPRPEQSLQDTPRLPERISLFQRNIERQSVDREELVDEIVVTLRHEVGHYLGLEEDDLERCGYD